MNDEEKTIYNISINTRVETRAVGDKMIATCVGGKHNGEEYRFTDTDKFIMGKFHAIKLQKLTDKCLEGGGCVEICKAEVTIS